MLHSCRLRKYLSWFHIFFAVELPPILVPRNHGETLPPHSELPLGADEISGGQVPANADLPLDLDEMDLLTNFSEVGSPTFSDDMDLNLSDDLSSVQMLGTRGYC